MPGPFYCNLHKDEILSWVCLERNCDERLVCSKCAIKVHDKAHNLEELANIKAKGFRSLINSNDISSFQSPIQLVALQESLLELERKLSESFKRSIEKFGETAHGICKEKDEIYRDMTQKLSHLEELDKRIIFSASSADEMSALVEESISTVATLQEELVSPMKKGYKLKVDVLNSLSASFLNTLNSYITNSVLDLFNHHFVLQLDLITRHGGPDVSDPQYLQFLDKKWNTDYGRVEENVNLMTSQLRNNIGFILQSGVNPASIEAEYYRKSGLIQNENYRQVVYVPQSPVLDNQFNNMMMPSPGAIPFSGLRGSHANCGQMQNFQANHGNFLPER